MSEVVALDFLRQSILRVQSARQPAGFEHETQLNSSAMQTVGHAMSTDVQSVSLSLPLARLFDRITGSRLAKHRGYPVVDDVGRLIGIIARSDLPDPSLRDELGWLIVADVMPSRPLIVAWPDESLQVAAERMLTAGVRRLPVVRPEMPDRMVGIISRSDIFKAMLRRTKESQHPIRHSRAA